MHEYNTHMCMMAVTVHIHINHIPADVVMVEEVIVLLLLLIPNIAVTLTLYTVAASRCCGYCISSQFSINNGCLVCHCT